MEKSEKIAICLYGQPRLVEKGYKYISEFIDRTSKYYNVDIFIHTWWSKTIIGQLYSHSPWRNITTDELLIKENDIDIIKHLYGPTKILVEEPKCFDEEINTIKQLDIYKNSPENIKNNINNTLSNLYSKLKVAELLSDYCSKNNYIYKGVVSLRFDFLNYIPFDFKISENNKIYTKLVGDRFYLCDHLIIFTDINLFFNFSKTYTNILSINESSICKEIANSIGIKVIINIEELITFNLLLYYSKNELFNTIIFCNNIPNFI
jgi:hypothetical protein